MENRVLSIDNVNAIDSGYKNFDMVQKEFLMHNLSLERLSTMQEALLALSKQDYLLIIIIEDTVDFMSQLHIMRDLKPMPIIVMSTVYEAETAIQAIEHGADAYIPKPETVQEFFAFSKALIRRYKEFNYKETVQTTVIAHKRFTMFPEHRKLFVNEQEVSLTRKEFDLLHLFFKNRGRVFTYEQIFNNIWGEEYIEGSNNALSVLISRLRQKLSIDASLECLRNVHDLGYTFDI